MFNTCSAHGSRDFPPYRRKLANFASSQFDLQIFCSKNFDRYPELLLLVSQNRYSHVPHSFQQRISEDLCNPKLTLHRTKAEMATTIQNREEKKQKQKQKKYERHTSLSEDMTSWMGSVPLPPHLRLVFPSCSLLYHGYKITPILVH